MIEQRPEHTIKLLSSFRIGNFSSEECKLSLAQECFGDGTEKETAKAVLDGLRPDLNLGSEFALSHIASKWAEAGLKLPQP